MSWLFGSSKKEEQPQTTQQQPINNNLGFDPNSITDVSSIISTPGGLDTSRLHPLAGLEKGVEYLDLEDENLNTLEGAQGLIPSRGWTDDLCYGTGAVYLLGLGLGGSYGFFEGLKNIPANSPGNTAGVLALTYNLVDSTIDGVRGKHDALNSVAAGAISGALFKSTKGLKPAGIASGLMAGAAAAWCGLKALLA